MEAGDDWPVGVNNSIPEAMVPPTDYDTEDDDEEAFGYEPRHGPTLTHASMIESNPGLNNYPLQYSAPPALNRQASLPGATQFRSNPLFDGQPIDRSLSLNVDRQNGHHDMSGIASNFHGQRYGFTYLSASSDGDIWKTKKNVS